MPIAVLGLGSIGMRHATNLLALDETVIGFDPDPERRNLLTEASGKAVDTSEKALNDAEAVIICSPNAFHLSDIQRVVQNGSHMLVEKPIAHTQEGVQEVINEAENKGLVIAAAMNLRFHPVVMKARELLSAPQVGQVVWGRFLCSSYLPDWRPHQDYRQGYTTDPKTGGVLFDIIHELDLAQYLLGPASVSACVAHKSGIIETNAEDCADVVFTHVSGVQSSIHLDYVSKNAQRFFEIQCENGLIKGDLIARSIIYTDHSGKDNIQEMYEGDFSQDYVEEMKGFLSYIRGDEGQICSASEAFKALNLVIDAREKAGL